MCHGGPTILLVDDDDMIRELLSTCLQKGGYNVATASNGDDALSLLEKEDSIKLLVTDIDMPKMSGIELAELATRTRAECRVLLISGSAPESSRVQWDFLAKPFRPSVLLNVVERMLDCRDSSPHAKAARSANGIANERKMRHG